MQARTAVPYDARATTRRRVAERTRRPAARWRAIQSPCAYSSHCSSPAMPRKDPTRVYEEAEPASAQAEGEDIDAVLAASAPDSAGSSAAADAGAPTNRAWLAPLARMRSRARMRACGKAAAGGARVGGVAARCLCRAPARSGPRSFFVPPRLFTAMAAAPLPPRRRRRACAQPSPASPASSSAPAALQSGWFRCGRYCFPRRCWRCSPSLMCCARPPRRAR